MIESDLVPKHDVLSEEEAKKIFEKYGATADVMPKISSSDPAIAELKPNVGDLIKITRKNPLMGEYHHYRVVIEG